MITREIRAADAGLETTGALRGFVAASAFCSPREIAVVTGVPVNLVRVRLHRARKRLKDALATESDSLSPARAACT